MQDVPMDKQIITEKNIKQLIKQKKYNEIMDYVQDNISNSVDFKELIEIQLFPFFMKNGLMGKVKELCLNGNNENEKIKAKKLALYIEMLDGKLRNMIINYSKMIGNYKAYLTQLFEVDLNNEELEKKIEGVNDAHRNANE